jgi:hypothetical protein
MAFDKKKVSIFFFECFSECLLLIILLVSMGRYKYTDYTGTFAVVVTAAIRIDTFF